MDDQQTLTHLRLIQVTWTWNMQRQKLITFCLECNISRLLWFTDLWFSKLIEQARLIGFGYQMWALLPPSISESRGTRWLWLRSKELILYKVHMILLTYTWGNPTLFWSQQINLHKITTLLLPHDSLPLCSRLRLYFITVIQQAVFLVLPLVGQQLRSIGHSTKHDQSGTGPSRLHIALQKWFLICKCRNAGMQSAKCKVKNYIVMCFWCLCAEHTLLSLNIKIADSTLCSLKLE